MTRGPKLEDNIQCQGVSSTSDLFNCAFKSSFRFQGRPSYRRSLRRLCLLEQSRFSLPTSKPMIFPISSNDVPKTIRTETVSTKFATIAVGTIFLSSLLALFLVYNTFPNVTPDERQYIKLPWNIQEAKQLGIILNRYKSDNYYQVMAGVFTSYIFLQTFAIPGSLFLSILAGFLFPFFVALSLVCTCSMLGASLCFLLSQLLGRRLVLKYFPKRPRAGLYK